MSDVAERPIAARLTEQPAANSFRFKLVAPASLSSLLIIGTVADSVGGSTVTLKGTPVWATAFIPIVAMCPMFPIVSVLSHSSVGWPRFAAAILSFAPALAGIASGVYFTRRQNQAIAAAAVLLRDAVLAEHDD